MIQRRFYDEGRTERYSDLGVKLREVATGELYDVAVDWDYLSPEYEETDIPSDTTVVGVEDDYGN
jgi:hypothetical protein